MLEGESRLGSWYDYGARWYDAAIGRFIGVDPIADEFAWVSEYNYAENEPVANIDLHGLQKYKPKMQEIEKPTDLVSSKMLNNMWEGTKTVAVEGGSLIGNGFNGLGKLIEGILPDQGRTKSSSFEDSGDLKYIMNYPAGHDQQLLFSEETGVLLTKYKMDPKTRKKQGRAYFFYEHSGNLSGDFNFVQGVKTGSAVSYHGSTQPGGPGREAPGKGLLFS